jgi:hypothetical protein
LLPVGDVDSVAIVLSVADMLAVVNPRSQWLRCITMGIELAMSLLVRSAHVTVRVMHSCLIFSCSLDLIFHGYKS